jgi:hypothetical protein
LGLFGGTYFGPDVMDKRYFARAYNP